MASNLDEGKGLVRSVGMRGFRGLGLGMRNKGLGTTRGSGYGG